MNIRTVVTPAGATPLPNGFTLLRPGVVMEHLITGERRPRLDLKVLDILDGIGAEPRDGVPSYSLYGGATITEVWDAANTRYTGCDARDPGGWFGFHVFKDSGSGPSNVPLQSKCTGRGSVNGNAYTRGAEWAAWEGSYFFNDVIPGFAAFSTSGAPGPSGGTYHPIQPNAYNAGLDGQQVSSARALDMASLFKTPTTAIAYVCRFSVTAASANIRGRLGTEAQPSQFTVPTQAANLQNSQVGIVNAGAGGALYLSVVDGNGQAGVAANVWITVAGYF